MNSNDGTNPGKHIFKLAGSQRLKKDTSKEKDSRLKWLQAGCPMVMFVSAEKTGWESDVRFCWVAKQMMTLTMRFMIFFSTVAITVTILLCLDEL